MIKPVAHWLVLSVSASDAAATLDSAMQYLMSGKAQQSRLAVMFECGGAEPGASEALMRVIHAAASLTSRVDKIPTFLASLAADHRLWQRLSVSQKGALQRAVELAGKAGLNVDALQRTLGSTASAEGIQVPFTPTLLRKCPLLDWPPGSVTSMHCAALMGRGLVHR